MRDRKMAVMSGIFLGVLVVGISASFLTRRSYISVGIEKIHTVSDMEELGIVTAPERQEASGEAITLYGDVIDGAEYELIVEPVGDFVQYRGSYAQRAKVAEVVSGDETLVGQTIAIYHSGGLYCSHNKIKFESSLELMYPENLYHVYLNESELNEYMEEKEFYF